MFKGYKLHSLELDQSMKDYKNKEDYARFSRRMDQFQGFLRILKQGLALNCCFIVNYQHSNPQSIILLMSKNDQDYKQFEYQKAQNSLQFNPTHDQQTSKSTYQAQYYNELEISQQQRINKSQLISILQSNQIRYNPEKFQGHIKIFIDHHTSNYQVIKIDVIYGYFSGTINIINVDSNGSFNHLAEQFSGSYGSVYKKKIGNTPIAIKSIKITERNFDNTFSEAVKEYFLLMIAASLRIGPTLVNLYGFNLVIFRDSLVFTMEFCEMKSQHSSQNLAQLKRKLHVLHCFNIVHLDIKPENIAFSLSYNSYVFIDFGLSRMVKEDIGSKTESPFVGSFNFCCDEMLELFVKNSSGYIDLYYNDAFCLKKSLKALKEQFQQPYEESFLELGQEEDFSHHESDVLIRIKFILFQACLTPTSKANLQSNQTIIQKNHLQLMKFINTLTQSLSFISVYKKYLKNQLRLDQDGFQNDRDIDKNQIPQLFSSRFLAIKNINEISKKIEINKPIFIDVDFYNEQKAKDYKYELYILMLIKFIRVNNCNTEFTSKIRACRVFSNLYMNLTQDLNDIQMYKATIEFIFEACFAQKEVFEVLETLENSIQTIIALEIVSEERLIKAYSQVLSLKTDFIKKMSLIFQFITSLEFVNEKYRTNYNYECITAAFMTRLNKFLDENIPECKYEYKLRKALKHVIVHKISEADDEDFDQIKQFDKTNNENNRDEIKEMITRIKMYMISNEVITQIDKYYYYNDAYLEYLIKEVKEQRFHSHHFQFAHFTIYNATFRSNKILVTQSVYKLFYEQFRHFEEYRFFNIYLFNLISKIKETNSKKLFIDRHQLEWKDKSGQQDILYAEIFEIFDYIIKNNSEFYTQLQCLFNIPTARSNPKFIECIERLIANNRGKITKLSGKLHKIGRFLHNNKLKNEILLINNILEFVSTEQFKQMGTQFLKQCQQILSQNTCFGCKASCLLQLKFFQITLNDSIRTQLQQSFLCILDLMIIYQKCRQFFRNGFFALVILIRLWRRKSFLYEKYDLKLLIYEDMRLRNQYHLCLEDISDYNVFLNIYLYVASVYPVDQLANFIINTVSTLVRKNSIMYINNFYYSIQYIVNVNKEGKQLPEFKSYHQQVILQLLPLINIRKHFFISLYFSSFLEITVNYRLAAKMLQTISLSLNYVDCSTRAIILNRYFYHFAFYLKSSPRKQKYLCKLHLKKYTKFKLKFILKIKMRFWQKQQNREKKMMQIKHCIERYHKNLGNVA